MKILDFNGLKSFTNKIKEKLTDKQDILVSGDNIATINGASLLEGGNIEVNQNAFSKVVVGPTTIVANAKQDTVELVQGPAIVIEADTANDKISISHKVTNGSIYKSDNPTTSISGFGASGTIRIPQLTVDKFGHVTDAADESVTITMPKGMNISGTVNLTNGIFDDPNIDPSGQYPVSYAQVFGDMAVGEMRMYLVGDSSGNLPSTSETSVTVPYDGILSPAQVYFGKSQAFGVSVGDICVLFKKSSLINICRIIPLNDVKPSNGDFPGADGLSTVWDKNRINKIDGIEWTANHVRDTYLPKADRYPSRADWLIHVDNCLENGVYPTCDTASLGLLGWQNQYTTVVVHRTSTEDNGGYHTIEQTAYGRGNDEGRISKRIIFYKSDGTDTQYRPWNTITFGVSVSLGSDSTALGYGAIASGSDSIALGNSAGAGGVKSTALGYGVIAGGTSSTSLGNSAIASGTSSTSLGNKAKASGYSSTALGYGAAASGSDSTALGSGATASGTDSIALGTNVEATADYSIALGMHNNPHFTENNDSATSLFTLGKGIYIKGNSSLLINRANALEIMKNNDIWFGEYNTGLKVYDGATNTTPFIEKKSGETSKVVLGNGELANIKELGAGTIEIKYEISEEENNNNDIVGLYNIITTMSNTFFDNKQNMWLYNDNIAYNVVIKGWYDNQYNNITYANLTVRLMSNRNGYKLGFNGFIDVDNVSENNSTDSQLCVGYVSGKYNITDDLLTVITPEKKFEISENKLII